MAFYLSLLIVLLKEGSPTPSTNILQTFIIWREINEVRKSQISPNFMSNCNILSTVIPQQKEKNEETSQSLRSRYDRHFVGITRYNALS